jgi:hypothetical protein
MSDYEKFLARKAISAPARGLRSTPPLAPHLFPFQRDTVEFALRVGTTGVFLDTGLGKTEVQLEWCRHASAATNGRSLILTPLAVAGQTKRRADRWGYEARVIREMADVYSPIAHAHSLAQHGGLDPLDHDMLWMRADRPFMDGAAGLIVYMADGWAQSKGMAEEARIFCDAGKILVYLERDLENLPNVVRLLRQHAA